MLQLTFCALEGARSILSGVPGQVSSVGRGGRSRGYNPGSLLRNSYIASSKAATS